MPEPPRYVKRISEDLSLSGADLIALIKQVTSKGGLFRFEVWGSSMHPCLRERDVVLLGKVDAEKGRLPLGTIVAYHRGSVLIIHRIIGYAADSYLIKGDYCFDHDGLVAPQAILARVVAIERQGRAVKRAGLGGEKLLIAKLSRRGLLTPLLNCTLLRRIISS
jgi:signal peptidase I